MTTISQPSTTEPKEKRKKENKNKLSKQLEQEQNHRNGDHLESYQPRGRGERIGGKIQGIRSIIGRDKIDRGS